MAMEAGGAVGDEAVGFGLQGGHAGLAVQAGAARTSRCTRFLACFPSGTRWKNSRGPAPSGSVTAEASLRFSGGTPMAFSASSHDVKLPGGSWSR